MPRDLWYFYESDLNKGNLAFFENSLPSHLRKMFVDSFGGLNILDRDVTNVLQGYRGPHNNGDSGDSEYLPDSDGLQEVRYWWGVSKHLLYVPFGAEAFIAARIMQDTEWHSLYFDSKTGECLSHNRDKAAKKLNDKGCQLFKEGKYAEAVEYHNNAYHACSSGYKYEQKFEDDRDKAKIEEDAKNINSRGEILFSKGKYTEAREKYQEAYDKSQISKDYNKYRANVEKAEAKIYSRHSNFGRDHLSSRSKYSETCSEYQETCNKSQMSYNEFCASLRRAEMYARNSDLRGYQIWDSPSDLSNYGNRMRTEGYPIISSFEGGNYCCCCKYENKMREAEIDAEDLNFQGNLLFIQRKYNEALSKYDKAYKKSQIEENLNMYQANIKRAKTEIDAMNFSLEGDVLFRQRRYKEALSEYEMACKKSQIQEEINIYQAKIKRAKTEVDAMNLSLKGDDLFRQRKYNEALSKYEMACEKSQIQEEINIYQANIKRAKTERDAVNFSIEGNNLFKQRKYNEALSKYEMACEKSQIQEEINIYQANIKRAKTEKDAMNFSIEGNDLFRHRKYNEALSKYEMACDKSQIQEEINIYQANIKRAKTEVDAMNLSLKGDHLFSEGKYTDAVMKYRAACDKSHVEKEKFMSALNKALALQNKLSILDTIWMEAWEAENDIVKDRSGEAKELFQRVLNETKDCLKIFPDNLRFKQYEILISLKIEGNELFNEGLEAQLDGSKLLQKAQKLKLQQKFESAFIKYKEAKSKFCEAQDKFKTGREKDQRFASCVGFVQDQLNDVLQSIELIEQHTLRSRLTNLNISTGKNNGLETDSYQCDTTVDHNDYYKLI